MINSNHKKIHEIKNIHEIQNIQFFEKKWYLITFNPSTFFLRSSCISFFFERKKNPNKPEKYQEKKWQKYFLLILQTLRKKMLFEINKSFVLHIGFEKFILKIHNTKERK